MEKPKEYSTSFRPLAAIHLIDPETNRILCGRRGGFYSGDNYRLNGLTWEVEEEVTRKRGEDVTFVWKTAAASELAEICLHCRRKAEGVITFQKAKKGA